jgi:hypothetical protein
MSDKKQTAVEWFLRKLYENDVIDLTGTQASNNLMGELYIQAKAMEKEQIIKTATDVDSTDFWAKYQSFENYYNETYES